MQKHILNAKLCGISLLDQTNDTLRIYKTSQGLSSHVVPKI